MATSSLENRQVQASEHVVSRAMADGEMVLLDLRSEQYFALNDLGARTWECMAAGHSLDQMVADVSTESGQESEVVTRDVNEFLDDLISAGLVTAET